MHGRPQCEARLHTQGADPAGIRCSPVADVCWTVWWRAQPVAEFTGGPAWGTDPSRPQSGPALEILYQPWIRGEENIPAEGAAILASNHLAVIDSFFLPLLVDREVAFIGKADYFTGKGVKGLGR